MQDGLNLSLNKTKTVLMTDNPKLSSAVEFEGIKKVDHTKYLGVSIHLDWQ